MQILCAISGLQFTCEHFPYTLEARETTHPVFKIPQKKLLSMAAKWSQGQFTPTDSYLYFLALLNSSDLVHWRCAVRRTHFTHSIVAQNMESLISALIRLNTVKNPEEIFPSFVVSHDQNNLSNVSAWLKSWETAYTELKAGYVSAYDSTRLLKREIALSKMISQSSQSPEKRAQSIAAWAAVAADFPTGTMDSPFQKGIKTSISDYWKLLIIRCIRNDNIFGLNLKDLEELYDHCIEFISVGPAHSALLFQSLRRTIERQKDLMELRLPEVSRTTGVPYSFVKEGASAEESNLLILCNNAPKEEPKESDYPSSFKFLQAKLRWEQAIKAGIRKHKQEGEV